MVNLDLIKHAEEFAGKKHKGQFRKNKSEPYVNHPLRVGELVRKFKKSHKIEELVSAGILHDTLEDTNTTLEELRENFGELIASIVFELTSNPLEIEKLGKTKYLSDKLSSNEKVSNWALVIKLADRLDNVSDLVNCSDENFVKRYKDETKEILKNLEQKRTLSRTHRKLIKEIRTII